MSVCSLAIFFSAPARAQAGFFADLINFFTAEPASADEDAALFSAIDAISTPLIGSQWAALHGTGGAEEEDEGALSVTQDSALVAAKNPYGNIVVEEVNGRDEITEYTVQADDTPSAIAKKFGISLNTLLWANNLTTKSIVKQGDHLVILPVSGIRYKVVKGDTLGVIAKRFKGDADEIASFNDLPGGSSLAVGDSIIIPNGELQFPAKVRASTKNQRVVAADGYYTRPIRGGKRTQGIHGYNGVDLAHACGAEVIASAGGKVIIARSDGWNGGYGRYVVISHPNKTQTLYAHLNAVYVVPGQTAEKGAQIGLLGNSGNSTGCHVHFEIRGARNPF